MSSMSDAKSELELRETEGSSTCRPVVACAVPVALLRLRKMRPSPIDGPSIACSGLVLERGMWILVVEQ